MLFLIEDTHYRATRAERTRARVVAGLKEMVVALVEVGDLEGAQRVAACLRSVATEPPSQEPPLHPLGSELKA